jgi:plastocyanin
MKHGKSSAGVIVAAIAAIIILVVGPTGPAMLSQTAIVAGQGNVNTTTTSSSTTTVGENAEERVAVGGGNLTGSINQFSPSTIQIQAGKSVTFYAPSGSTEVHNVMFDLSNGTAISSIYLRFILPSGVSPEALQLAPPDNIGEPIIKNTSDGRQTIVALNKVAFHPSVVNQQGNVSYLQEHEFIPKIEQARQQGLIMPPLSVNYTMQGTERIVSSGLILDVAGFEPLRQQQGGGETVPTQSTADNSTNPEAELPPPPYPILSNFTVTFERPGMYPFLCAFHPGMGGIVNVTQ